MRLCTAILLGLLVMMSGCRVRGEPPLSGAPESPATRPATTAKQPGNPVQPAQAKRVVPVLDHEPEISIFLFRGPRLDVTLLASMQVSGKTFPKGTVSLSAGRGGVIINGQAVGDVAVMLSAADPGKPGFSLTLTPPFGKSHLLQCEGSAVIRVIGREIEVVERLPMERYLASVIAAEMNPSWPTAALAAQALAARSYAAARWMERCDQSWHLHWHYSVDMAYGGWRASRPSIDQAIAQTRGEVLICRGVPVQALFHASSGGRTESAIRLKPDLIGPDGVTAVADAMVSVDDPAAQAGAAGLGMTATHWRWKADIPLAEISTKLQKWSRAQSGRPVFGTAVDIRPGERAADSQRLITVVVSHQLNGKRQSTSMRANDFRLAVSPVQIRSTWWERCVIASTGGGTVVIEGRGFGHGVGLSQISAWQLARQGVSPEDIVSRFYVGARIEKRW